MSESPEGSDHIRRDLIVHYRRISQSFHSFAVALRNQSLGRLPKGAAELTAAILLGFLAQEFTSQQTLKQWKQENAPERSLVHLIWSQWGGFWVIEPKMKRRILRTLPRGQWQHSHYWREPKLRCYLSRVHDASPMEQALIWCQTPLEKGKSAFEWELLGNGWEGFQKTLQPFQKKRVSQPIRTKALLF